MLLLATLLVAAAGERVARPTPAGLVALLLGFGTVLLGALTANLGAASACLGFPLCNGQLAPAGNVLQHIHWTHRLLAYALVVYAVWWAVRARPRGACAVVATGVLVTEIVDGRPRPGQLAVDRVTGAMDEVVGQARRADHAARRVIHGGAGDGPAHRPALLEQVHGGLARPLHCLPHAAHVGVRGAPREPHPGLVSEHRTPPGPGPQVEQHDVARPAPAGRPGLRLALRQGARRRA